MIDHSNDQFTSSLRSKDLRLSFASSRSTFFKSVFFNFLFIFSFLTRFINFRLVDVVNPDLINVIKKIKPYKRDVETHFPDEDASSKSTGYLQNRPCSVLFNKKSRSIEIDADRAKLPDLHLDRACEAALLDA